MNIRELYRFLRFLQDVQRKDSTAAVEELISETKRKIRALNHQSIPLPAGVIETGGINREDGWIEIVLLEPSFSREDAEEFFEEHMRREYVYYPWDCTGQRFTQWHSIFRTPRGWRIYHSIGIDV